MNIDAINELAELLEDLARDYPAQPQWSDLAHQVRSETVMIQEPTGPPPGPAKQPETTTNQLCCLCGLTPTDDGTVMCLDCSAMFQPVTWRAVQDVCSCGHRAVGRQVYIYRKGHEEQSLCGLPCAQAHFRKVFAPFLGEST